MAFTVDDFEDLVRLLEERPEWRARLRELLLPRELLELPALVRDLAEMIREMQGRMVGVERGLERVENRVERVETDLSEFRRETTERFDAVDQRFEQVDRRFEQVDRRFDSLDENVGWLRTNAQRQDTDFGKLKGPQMEQRYQDRSAYFEHLIARPYPLSSRELADWLRERVAEGRLEPAEAQRVLRVDIVFRGGDPADPEYLAVEVSWAVDQSDVRRAADRAALLRKTGVRVMAAVAGQRIEPEAVALAERTGVARVIEEELDALDDAAAAEARES